MEQIKGIFIGLIVVVILYRVARSIFYGIWKTADRQGYRNEMYIRREARNAGEMAAMPWVIAAVICLFFAPCISILLFLIAGAVQSCEGRKVRNRIQNGEDIYDEDPEGL